MSKTRKGSHRECDVLLIDHEKMKMDTLKISIILSYIVLAITFVCIIYAAITISEQNKIQESFCTPPHNFVDNGGSGYCDGKYFVCDYRTKGCNYVTGNVWGD